jgi:ATP-dependent Clp protease ATP-binding subunit ClpC
MFERYTENARRTIFFALREASAVGSPRIETAHLLVGLLEAAPEILVRLSVGPVTPEALRSRLHAPPDVDAPGEMSTDRPLSSASKQVLFFALEEAEPSP